MTKKKSLIKKYLKHIIIALTIIAIIIVFSFKKTDSSKQSSFQDKNTPAKKMSDIKTYNTENWTVFNKNKYGFSIKYPKGLDIEINDGGSETPPSKETGLVPAFYVLVDNKERGLRISINPEGYYGIQYSKQKSDFDTIFINGIQTNVFTDNYYVEYDRLYNFVGIEKYPSFSITASFLVTDMPLVEQIISTIKIED